jgi:hypothetical protein
MITIFWEFRQFSAKKLAFFSNTNVMIKILHNLVKNANFFAEFFGENILKIITSVPVGSKTRLKNCPLPLSTFGPRLEKFGCEENSRSCQQH